MNDLEAIKNTVFDYFDGLRLADRTRLERAFAVDAGHMKGYLKDPHGKFALSVRPMHEVIDTWAKREPTPDMHGAILSVEIYSPVAATVLFDFNGVFTDALQLAKVDDEWRIVNKFYVNR